jgi:hypothetical protein
MKLSILTKTNLEEEVEKKRKFTTLGSSLDGSPTNWNCV